MSREVCNHNRLVEDFCYECKNEQINAYPTLRDQFAMAALTGIVIGNETAVRDCATMVYKLADAMMKEREK